PARDATIGVSVQVVDRRPASALLDAIPVPEQARMFDANAHARSYALVGTPESAAAFFETECRGTATGRWRCAARARRCSRSGPASAGGWWCGWTRPWAARS